MKYIIVLFVVYTMSFLVACSSENSVLEGDEASLTNQEINEDPAEATDTFSTEKELLDRGWDLVSYTGVNGIETNLVENSLFRFLAESESGELRASINCNQSGGGSYTFGDGFVVLSLGLVTDIACGGLSGMQFLEQQEVLRDLLGGQGESNTDSRELMISIDVDTLVLTAPDGRKLQFVETDDTQSI